MKVLFHEARDLPPARRSRFLQDACAGDAALLAEVQSLLAAEDEAGKETSGDLTGAVVDRYRIIGKLGRGGMGEVYRARDQKLDRDVALKILAPWCLGDEELLRRFRAEPRAASALQHPNICTVYDIGEWKGRPYLTMECLEGQTLQQRLRLQSFSEPDLIRLGLQIAEALGAAHAKGIIHRDIKPANIFLTSSTAVKVVDFGIAKQTEASDDNLQLTSPGTLMGTLAYMSPEQARAEKVDARADLYSLGAVLYEMAAGRPPFKEPTSALVYQAILHRAPDSPRALRPSISPQLEQVILRLLEKEPGKRYPDAASVVAALGTATAAKPASPSITARSGRRRMALISLGPLIVLAAGLIWRRPDEQPLRLKPFTSYSGAQESPVFSPQGTQVAFIWAGEDGSNRDIYIRLTSGGSPLRLTNHPASDLSPAWSPDGRHIAFLRWRAGAENGYYMIPALGGLERKLAPAFEPPSQKGGRNLDWSPDGASLVIADRISASRKPSLYRLTLGTGETSPLQAPGAFVGSPAFSPDGRWLAFTSGPSTLSHDIFIMPSSGGPARRLTYDHGWLAGLTWTRDSRHIIYSSNHNGLFRLWRVPAAGGATQAVTAAGHDAFSPSIHDSRLVYVRSQENQNLWMMPLREVGAPMIRLFPSSRVSAEPEFSPDGRAIVFSSDRSGSWEIWTGKTDGSAPAQLTNFAGPQTGSPRFSPDGKWIAFDSRPAGFSQIYLLPTQGGQAKQITIGDWDHMVPRFSSDARHLYFLGNRDGETALYRMPVNGGEPVRVTGYGITDGWEQPGGRWLFVLREGVLLRLPHSGGPEEKILDGVNWRDVAPASGGVYFVSNDPQGGRRLEYYDYLSRARTFIRKVNQTKFGGVPAISADGRWLIMDQADQMAHEILLVENFR